MTKRNRPDGPEAAPRLAHGSSVERGHVLLPGDVAAINEAIHWTKMKRDLRLDEARIEVARRVEKLLQNHAGKLWADEDWQMGVT
jgi:hypothetical protein